MQRLTHIQDIKMRAIERFNAISIPVKVASVRCTFRTFIWSRWSWLHGVHGTFNRKHESITCIGLRATTQHAVQSMPEPPTELTVSQVKEIDLSSFSHWLGSNAGAHKCFSASMDNSAPNSIFDKSYFSIISHTSVCVWFRCRASWTNMNIRTKWIECERLNDRLHLTDSVWNYLYLFAVFFILLSIHQSELPPKNDAYLASRHLTKCLSTLLFIYYFFGLSLSQCSVFSLKVSGTRSSNRTLFSIDALESNNNKKKCEKRKRHTKSFSGKCFPLSFCVSCLIRTYQRRIFVLGMRTTAKRDSWLLRHRTEVYSPNTNSIFSDDDKSILSSTSNNAGRWWRWWWWKRRST